MARLAQLVENQRSRGAYHNNDGPMDHLPTLYGGHVRWPHQSARRKLT